MSRRTPPSPLRAIQTIETMLRDAAASRTIVLALCGLAFLAPRRAFAQAVPGKSLSLSDNHAQSAWQVFLGAGTIVQTVIVVLLLALLVTWTIWIVKTIQIGKARFLARRNIVALSSAENLRGAERALARDASPVALFATAALGEADRSASLPPDGVKERAAILLQRIEASAIRQVYEDVAILSMIGATAPLVGLLGAAWAIRNAFALAPAVDGRGLGDLAPRLSEAIQACVMGLAVAIPAVVLFNLLSRSIANYRGVLGDARAEVLRHLSRDLDSDRARPARQSVGANGERAA